MVTFFIGRSGSGKTELIHRLFRNGRTYKKTILIVPEQSSFTNEKKLLHELGAKGAKEIEVLSFKRLCGIVFEMYSGITDRRVTDGGKAVLMSRAIDAVSDQTQLFTVSKRRKTSLIDPMLTAVNEYKLCGITPEMLTEAAVGINDPRLAAKMNDSALIYAAYNALLRDRYSDPDDDLERLCELLKGKGFFSGMRVCFDSFTGFSEREMDVVKLILKEAEDVYFSLCADRELLSKDNTIFSEAARTYRQLLRSAQLRGHKCIVSDDPAEGLRYGNNSIAAVERGVFSAFRSGTAPAAVGDDGCVRIYKADDIYDEIRFAAGEIFRLVNDGGHKYSDIEIITRRPEVYANAIASEFPKYDIPCFLSSPEPVGNKPLVRFIVSGLEAVLSHFETEAVLRFAKTGLTPLKTEEIFSIENYAYIRSINHNGWKKPFTLPPDGNDITEKSQKLIDELEKARESLISPLIGLKDALRSAENGGDITKALYELMTACDAQKHFRGYIHRIRDTEGASAAEREASVWDMTMELLSDMYALTEDVKLSPEEYSDLLRLYIKKCSLSEIPQTVNCVTVGTAGAIRSANPRTVFVIGASAGEFPAKPSAVGIFTDSERHFLRDEREEDKKLPLYDSIFGAALKEKYAAYTALSAPREKLYVSYYTRSVSGAPGEPSPMIKDILRAIDGLEEEVSPALTGEEPDPARSLFTERQGFDLCAALYGSKSSFSDALCSYYEASPEYRDRADALRRAADREPFRIHDLKLTRSLYGTPLRLSSTRLDKFSGCKFSYFCSYGLKAYPVKKIEMDNLLFGEAVHYIFETILGKKAGDGIIKGVEELKTATEEQIRTSVRACMDNYLSEHPSRIQNSERFNALCRKVCMNSVRTLLRMKQQYLADTFLPVSFELEIGGDEPDIPSPKLTLPTGEDVLLTGKVDRVDKATINGQEYIRIIDYKTGNTKFSFKSLAGGINIQMLLYLSAILKNEAQHREDKTVSLPAGVLYVPSEAKASPAENSSESARSAAIKEQNSNFRMNGLLLENKDVLYAMNDKLNGEFIQPVITKAGEFDKRRGSLVTQEEFENILKYVDVCLRYVAEELYMGAIEAYPMSGSCKFCDYHSVCRFEEGSKTFKLPKTSKKEAMEHIKAVLVKEGIIKEEKEEESNEQ